MAEDDRVLISVADSAESSGVRKEINIFYEGVVSPSNAPVLEDVVAAADTTLSTEAVLGEELSGAVPSWQGVSQKIEESQQIGNIRRSSSRFIELHQDAERTTPRAVKNTKVSPRPRYSSPSDNGETRSPDGELYNMGRESTKSSELDKTLLDTWSISSALKTATEPVVEDQVPGIFPQQEWSRLEPESDGEGGGLNDLDNPVEDSFVLEHGHEGKWWAEEESGNNHWQEENAPEEDNDGDRDGSGNHSGREIQSQEELGEKHSSNDKHSALLEQVPASTEKSYFPVEKPTASMSTATALVSTEEGQQTETTTQQPQQTVADEEWERTGENLALLEQRRLKTPPSGLTTSERGAIIVSCTNEDTSEPTAKTVGECALSKGAQHATEVTAQHGLSGVENTREGGGENQKPLKQGLRNSQPPDQASPRVNGLMLVSSAKVFSGSQANMAENSTSTKELQKSTATILWETSSDKGSKDERPGEKQTHTEEKHIGSALLELASDGAGEKTCASNTRGISEPPKESLPVAESTPKEVVQGKRIDHLRLSSASLELVYAGARAESLVSANKDTTKPSQVQVPVAEFTPTGKGQGEIAPPWQKSPKLGEVEKKDNSEKPTKPYAMISSHESEDSSLIEEKNRTFTAVNANVLPAHDVASVIIESLQKKSPQQEWEGEIQQSAISLLPEPRQHSTPNLVALRRINNRSLLSLELFEEDDSDSSTEDSEGVSVSERKKHKDENEEEKDIVPWEQSIEGRSRMVQVAKATVSSNPTRTSKYLKIFSPTNSAHDTYPVLAALHRRMNGTWWPRRGGWGSYLIRKSQAELDSGRVYGVRSKDGSVELINLPHNNVCGRIPVITARLGSLKCINLSNNRISGAIPAELGLLLQLQTLQLQGNNLRESISPLLGSLISLVRLSLGNNKLTGAIPESLSSLVHLQFLSVEQNRLSGNIPGLVCHLPVLETFNASNNKLEGEIPAGIGFLRMMKKLDFGNNLLTGEIPPSLCSLKYLNWLRLDNNLLTGPIPKRLGDLKSLLILNLSFNRLSGRVPEALGVLSDLTTSNLRRNFLEGPLPFPTNFQVRSGMGGLWTLDLGSNGLAENFPDLTGLRQLQILALDDNRLYGSMSEGLAGACPNLFKLHLQKNRLTGEIPENIGALSKLEVLDLSDNCLEGGLPTSLRSLLLLRTFSAADNELSGELPSFLGDFTMLTKLTLNGNKFNGPIPRELGKLVSLERLYLERNELVGSIPAELSKCLCLKELYLHQNKLWGKIPDSLRSLVGLRYLFLYRNRLTGTVPEWLGGLHNLRGLVLGENRLRGPIPWQLGHLHKLQDLYLNDNNLEGHIPERLVVNCERLQRLYLGGNRLIGRVPRQLRHLQDLRELNIERNNLHGELPIPLFLKTSLGPNACGLKFDGNPRIVDSREHFTSTVGICFAGLQPAPPVILPSSDLNKQQQDHHHQQHQHLTMQPLLESNDLSVQAPECSTSWPRSPARRSNPPISLRDSISEMTYQETRKEGPGLDLERGVDADSAYNAYGDDRSGVGQPWATGEDAYYFLFKVVVGNASAILDLFVAARLYWIGCVWGSFIVVIWKLIAALEGVLVTQRLGYGGLWLSLAAVGLALPLQARRCYHHSCESDLFQMLQQVEWRWHALIQLATQLAATLACWDSESMGFVYVWLSMGMKALVIGVVNMQRLDDKRVSRAGKEILSTSLPPLASAVIMASLKSKLVPWLRDSAWPRLIFVGFHVAEVGERSVPIACFTATLGYWAFLAPLAMVPGMTVRYLVRRRHVAAGGNGIISAVKATLAISLALDSAFGSRTPAHLIAAIATTVETVIFFFLAGSAPHSYPDYVDDALVSGCTMMLIYTWLVLLLEKVLRLGGQPPLPLPPPSPRLSTRSPRPSMMATIHVQPLVSVLPCTASGSDSEIKEDDAVVPLWAGSKGLASVVPMEESDGKGVL